MSNQEPGSDLLRELGGRVRHAERIRLGVGVTGRTTTMVVVALLALGAAAWSMNSDWMKLVAVGAIVAVVMVGMFGNWDFASKHPDAALLEGADFRRLRETEMAAKGVPALPNAASAPNPEYEQETIGGGGANG